MGGVQGGVIEGQAGRVLMIAHHFPPAGGSGANRALAFARYLPAYGWEPLVLTPGTAWATNPDARLLAEIAPGLRVLRTASLEARPPRPRPSTGTVGAASRARWAQSWLEPRGAPRGDETGIESAARWPRTDATASRGGFASDAGGRGTEDAPGRALGGLSEDVARHGVRSLRSNLGHLKRFPDAHVGWLPYAVAAGRRLRYDVAYSSSGPFTSHLVGLALKRLTHRPWVAELRDGWYRWNRAIFPDYPAWRNVLERRLEAMALRSADRVVLVTDRMAAAFRQQYLDLPADHFAVVPNGFDRLQFPATLAEEAPTDTFEVLHAGALYYGRSLAAFVEAARRLIASDAAFAEHFRLTLVGTLDANAQAELTQPALGERTSLRGQLDHPTTIAAMCSASLLLLAANTTPGAEATVPAKLFEYLAVGRPILAIAPAESSTADVLARTGGGWLAPAGDAAAIACSLHQAFQAHQAGAPRQADALEVARFDRRLLAGDLASVFARATRRL